MEAVQMLDGVYILVCSALMRREFFDIVDARVQKTRIRVVQPSTTLTAARTEIESIVSKERANSHANYRSALTGFRVPIVPRAIQNYVQRSQSPERGALAQDNWRYASSPRALNILAGFSQNIICIKMRVIFFFFYFLAQSSHARS